MAISLKMAAPPTDEEILELHAYIANGTRVAVLVDPYHVTVEVYLPDREVQIFASPKSVPLDPVLPGFVLELEPIFG